MLSVSGMIREIISLQLKLLDFCIKQEILEIWNKLDPFILTVNLWEFENLSSRRLELVMMVSSFMSLTVRFCTCPCFDHV